MGNVARRVMWSAGVSHKLLSILTISPIHKCTNEIGKHYSNK